MIEPFGAILRTRYRSFQRMGFHVVSEGDYRTILQSENNTIALTIERYTSADIQLNFIGLQGQIYPLWMIRLMIDMDGYGLDKTKLHSIQDEYGLRDGSEGVEQFRQGVNLYTVTYLEFALKFLQKNLYLVNLNAEKFKSELLSFSHF